MIFDQDFGAKKPCVVFWLQVPRKILFVYTGWWHRSSEDWAMSNLAQIFVSFFVWHMFSSMSPITWHRYIFHVATYLSKIFNFKARKLYSSRLFWKLRYFRPLFDPWARDKISKFSGTLLPAPTCCGPALGWQTANIYDMWLMWRERNRTPPSLRWNCLKLHWYLRVP